MEILEGNPSQPGLYVAYINPEVPAIPFAKRALLVWHEGQWSHPLSDQRYRDHVYGFIGPLPAMPLEG